LLFQYFNRSDNFFVGFVISRSERKAHYIFEQSFFVEGGFYTGRISVEEYISGKIEQGIMKRFGCFKIFGETKASHFRKFIWIGIGHNRDYTFGTAGNHG